MSGGAKNYALVVYEGIYQEGSPLSDERRTDRVETAHVQKVKINQSNSQ
ncbi:MAG: hypothetical protein HFH96_08500 [Lachnospiraceae bacterium]|nr:hypothetical protein [uncultured Acetatifactor sp.]MCI9231132.1 hypothetical protein [Lachnospiraceae bacterium]